ncbi:2Fe-2S iron-sulfur cluster-binding protein [uncultured Hyphomicrobium sp.]|jgi:propane monooxygenase reductase subunit|uniref:NADH:ubiquinone reductase (Na(+)-transporting) subunit F n=1 Tax=uncultured Hyphomicrobium sp. TaxID=194373 RepID=UPI0025E99F58|nr:2Fe-2S iron-sulfur cluster-binding protein [uncultured Hyphomicrobium sp.]
MTTVHKVTFEPVGVEMNVEEGETVLDAAFRQGIAVPHGCKEGQCSSCKCKLIEGDIDLLKYSTFALPDHERDDNHILLCRTQAFSDLTVELLNFDEEALSRSIAVKEFSGEVRSVTSLTHDIRLLEIEVSEPLKFWAGQYVDITIPSLGVTRSYSMANPPSENRRLQFIIKKYPDGAFSALLDNDLQPGTPVAVKGPYGGCFRREGRDGPMVLVGGGSGMSPLWSILHDQIESGERRPIRFFYGARSDQDLFYLEEFASIASKIADFEFIPALSQQNGSPWAGETGFVHDVVQRRLLAEGLSGDIDAYSCGPPPMIDAVMPVLFGIGVEPSRFYYDKFTQPAKAI